MYFFCACGALFFHRFALALSVRSPSFFLRFLTFLPNLLRSGKLVTDWETPNQAQPQILVNRQIESQRKLKPETSIGRPERLTSAANQR